MYDVESRVQRHVFECHVPERGQDWVLGAQTVPLDCFCQSGLPFGYFVGEIRLGGLLCQSLSSEGALRFYTQTTARGRCLWRRAHRLKQYTKTGLGSTVLRHPIGLP